MYDILGVMFLDLESEVEMEERFVATSKLVFQTLEKHLDRISDKLNKSLSLYYDQRLATLRSQQQQYGSEYAHEENEILNQLITINQDMAGFVEEASQHFELIFGTSHSQASFIARQVSCSLAANVKAEAQMLRLYFLSFFQHKTIAHVFRDRHWRQTLSITTSTLFWDNIKEIRRVILQDSFGTLKGVRLPLRQYQDMQLELCLVLQRKSKATAKDSFLWVLSPELFQLIWGLAAAWS